LNLLFYIFILDTCPSTARAKLFNFTALSHTAITYSVHNKHSLSNSLSACPITCIAFNGWGSGLTFGTFTILACYLFCILNSLNIIKFYLSSSIYTFHKVDWHIHNACLFFVSPSLFRSSSKHFIQNILESSHASHIHTLKPSFELIKNILLRKPLPLIKWFSRPCLIIHLLFLRIW
jgi:hypothetical protein